MDVETMQSCSTEPRLLEACFSPASLDFHSACFLSRVFSLSRFSPVITVHDRFPSELEEITFGKRFNQPIDAVKWLLALRCVTFGHYFNCPVVGSARPSSETRLIFGRSFDQPLQPGEHEDVTWPPASLESVIVEVKFSGDAAPEDEMADRARDRHGNKEQFDILRMGRGQRTGKTR